MWPFELLAMTKILTCPKSALPASYRCWLWLSNILLHCFLASGHHAERASSLVPPEGEVSNASNQSNTWLCDQSQRCVEVCVHSYHGGEAQQEVWTQQLPFSSPDQCSLPSGRIWVQCSVSHYPIFSYFTMFASSFPSFAKVWTSAPPNSNIVTSKLEFIAKGYSQGAPHKVFSPRLMQKSSSSITISKCPTLLSTMGMSSAPTTPSLLQVRSWLIKGQRILRKSYFCYSRSIQQVFEGVEPNPVDHRRPEKNGNFRPRADLRPSGAFLQSAEYVSLFQILIDRLLKWFFVVEGCKFSSSGREDVDVRTLGLGRPFAIELIDPHRTLCTQEDLTRLQEKINKSTDAIAIRHLQIVTKDQLAPLKEGEEEKTKIYSALCVTLDGPSLTQKEVGRLDGITELVINQKTPLRVLHRYYFGHVKWNE